MREITFVSLTEANIQTAFLLGLLSRSTTRREKVPPFFCSMKKELSLFIDESRDFRFKKGVSDFYFLTFVLHEQSKNISTQIERIRHVPCFHAGSLIRCEHPYESLKRIMANSDA